MIDVLDENGVKTGEVVTRKEVHKKGLWHRAILVAIIDERKQILMQQRSFQKEKNAGMWDISVAGHVSSGQISVEAATREIREELGIQVNNTDLKLLISYPRIRNIREDFTEKEICDFYVVQLRKIDVKQIVIQEAELQDIKLVNLEEFKNMIQSKNMVQRPIFYEALLNYLSKI